LKLIQEFPVSGGHGGKRAGAGRPKGRVSQETADIKAMVIGALQAVGGAEYLAARALDTPTAFMALVGRVLPLQVSGQDGGPVHISIDWAPATPVSTNGHTVDTNAIPAGATVIDAEQAALEIVWEQVTDATEG
jgi:hypothetical protein